MIVTCGDTHTAAVTEKGELYAWGEGDIDTLLTRVDFINPESIFMVVAGEHRSAAVASGGSVHTWGVGWAGVCGHGHEWDHNFPARLLKESFGGSPTVMVTVGWHFTVVVTADGTLWTFGTGREGQLGHVNREKRLVPMLVDQECFGGARSSWWRLENIMS